MGKDPTGPEGCDRVVLPEVAEAGVAETTEQLVLVSAYPEMEVFTEVQALWQTFANAAAIPRIKVPAPKAQSA